LFLILALLLLLRQAKEGQGHRGTDLLKIMLMEYLMEYRKLKVESNKWREIRRNGIKAFDLIGIITFRGT
jgi:hypothetical protein